MTKCAKDYCEAEDLVQISERTIYAPEVRYWLCNFHWEELQNQKSKLLKLDPVEYDYVEKDPNRESFFVRIMRSEWFDDPVVFIILFCTLISVVILTIFGILKVLGV